MHNYFYQPKYFYKDNINYYEYLDTVIVQQQALSFNLKSGYELLYKNLVVDFYYGIGIRHTKVQYALQRYPNAIDATWYIAPFDNSQEPVNEWGLNVELNLRIGIYF